MQSHPTKGWLLFFIQALPQLNSVSKGGAAQLSFGQFYVDKF
jgi:hypothetical protein